AGEEGLSASGVARDDARCRRLSERSQVGDDRSRLSFREVAWWHGGARDTAEDDLHDLIVGRSSTEPAAAEIHRRDAVAVGTVARGAIVLIEQAAVLDVGGRVPVSLRVSQRGPDEDRRGQEDGASHHAWNPIPGKLQAL